MFSSTDVNCWDDTDGTIQVSVDDYTNVLGYDFALDGILNTNPHPLDTFLVMLVQVVILLQLLIIHRVVS